MTITHEDDVVIQGTLWLGETLWMTNGYSVKVSSGVDAQFGEHLTIASGSLDVSSGLLIYAAGEGDSPKLTMESEDQEAFERYVAQREGQDNVLIEKASVPGGENRLFEWKNGNNSTLLSISGDGHLGVHGNLQPFYQICMSNNECIGRQHASGSSHIQFNDAYGVIVHGGPLWSKDDLFADGDVGIGTSGPDCKLHVRATTDQLTRFQALDGHTGIYLHDYGGEDLGYLDFRQGAGDVLNGRVAQYSQSHASVPGLFSIENRVAGKDMRFMTTPTGGSVTERMRIKENGEVLFLLYTDDLGLIDAIDTGGTTGSGFVRLEVGGNTRYIRIYSSS